MLVGVIFSFTSLLYSILLNTIFHTKKNMANEETKIFSRLLLINLLGIIIEFTLSFVGYTNKDFITSPSMSLLVKVYFSLLILITTILTLYVFVIIKKRPRFNKEELEKFEIQYHNIKKLIFLITVIIVAIQLALPIKMNSDFTNEGLGRNFILFITTLFPAIWLLLIVINFKGIQKKKLIPFVMFYCVYTVTMIIQKKAPSLAVISSIELLVFNVMYFTIENPDLKMLEQVNWHRKLVEATNEEQSNTLFKITQNFKKKVNDIIYLSDRSIKEEDLKYIKADVRNINISAKELNDFIDELLNISYDDLKRIKMLDILYDTTTLFDSIRLMAEKEIKDSKKEIDFRYKISKIIPKYLRGDSVKIKQIIYTILSNCVKSVEKGFINLEVTAINKYDLTRLIIKIEDSGEPLDIKEINDILAIEENISEEDLKNLDDLDVGMLNVNKIVKLLGGNLIIRNEEDYREFLVIINQKKESLEKERFVSYDKKILIIDDEESELKAIKKIVESLGYDTSSILDANEGIYKLKHGEEYDLVLIDDEMKVKSGINTLYEVQKLENFNIPCVVMLKEDKLKIKQVYLEDGFSDYVDKTKLREELKRILKKV